MIEESKHYYGTIIIIDSLFEDKILDDYQMLIQSMYLTKYIAEKRLEIYQMLNTHQWSEDYTNIMEKIKYLNYWLINILYSL